MATRINYPYPRRRPVALSVNATLPPRGERTCEEACERSEEKDCENQCCRCVRFCEVLSLPAGFDASGICEDSASIAYNPAFLAYSMEPVEMDVDLPCGGCCKIELNRLSLSGAIPYIVSVGPVTGTCGDSVCLSVSGVAMVDVALGYACGEEAAETELISCENISTEVQVERECCGENGGVNLIIKGSFCLNNLFHS